MALKPSTCPSCGEILEEGMSPHETVERIVRPHHIFAGRKPGEVVHVEPRHLAHNSVVKATMSVEEYHKLMAPAPAKSAGPSMVERVREFTKMARDNFLREKESRKASLERQSERALEEARKL
jgi:hypothetical protein